MIYVRASKKSFKRRKLWFHNLINGRINNCIYNNGIIQVMLTYCHSFYSLLLHWLAPWLDRQIGAGKSYWRGRLSTVDLLVLTSLDQLLFILKILLNSFTKQAILMRRSTVLSLTLSISWMETDEWRAGCQTVVHKQTEGRRGSWAVERTNRLKDCWSNKQIVWQY